MWICWVYKVELITKVLCWRPPQHFITECRTLTFDVHPWTLVCIRVNYFNTISLLKVVENNNFSTKCERKISSFELQVLLNFKQLFVQCDPIKSVLSELIDISWIDWWWRNVVLFYINVHVYINLVMWFELWLKNLRLGLYMVIEKNSICYAKSPKWTKNTGPSTRKTGPCKRNRSWHHLTSYKRVTPIQYLLL